MREKGFAPAILLILVVILSGGIVGGSFYIKNNTAFLKRETTVIPTSNPTPEISQEVKHISVTPTPTPSIYKTNITLIDKYTAEAGYSPVDTTKWKSVTNKACKIESLYPPTWTVKESVDGAQDYVGELHLWNGCVLRIETGSSPNSLLSILVYSKEPGTKLNNELEKMAQNVERQRKTYHYENLFFNMEIDGKWMTAALNDQTSTRSAQATGFLQNKEVVYGILGTYQPNEQQTKDVLFTVINNLKFH